MAKKFTKSDTTKKYDKKTSQYEKKVENYADFNYGRQADYDSIIDSIINRDAFNYDATGDALYENYKNQYTALGQLAMKNTMGQASAMTGGYGSSYSQMAGQQAFDAYMNQLSEKIPELYQLAQNTYQMETDNLNNKFSVLSSDRQAQYGEYNDKYQRVVDSRDYYSGKADSSYNNDWNKYEFNTNLAYQTARDAVSDNQWQKEFDYQKKRDSVSDNQWNKEFNYQQKRDNIADSQWEKEYKLKKANSTARKGSGGGGNYVVNPSETKTLSAEEYKTLFLNNYNGKGIQQLAKENPGIFMNRGEEGQALATAEALKNGKITTAEAQAIYYHIGQDKNAYNLSDENSDISKYVTKQTKAESFDKSDGWKETKETAQKNYANRVKSELEKGYYPDKSGWSKVSVTADKNGKISSKEYTERATAFNKKYKKFGVQIDTNFAFTSDKAYKSKAEERTKNGNIGIYDRITQFYGSYQGVASSVNEYLKSGYTYDGEAARKTTTELYYECEETLKQLKANKKDFVDKYGKKAYNQYVKNLTSTKDSLKTTIDAIDKKREVISEYRKNYADDKSAQNAFDLDLNENTYLKKYNFKTFGDYKSALQRAEKAYNNGNCTREQELEYLWLKDYMSRVGYKTADKAYIGKGNYNNKDVYSGYIDYLDATIEWLKNPDSDSEKIEKFLKTKPNPYNEESFFVLNRTIKELEEEKNAVIKKHNDFIKNNWKPDDFKTIVNSADFDKIAKKGADKSDNELQFYLNNKNASQSEMTTLEKNIIARGKNNNWDLLTDDEIKYYNYCIGIGDKDKAKKYLSNSYGRDMNEVLEKRAQDNAEKEFVKQYNDSDWLEKAWMNIKTVPANLLGNIGGFVKDTSDILTKGYLTNYQNSIKDYSDKVRSLTREDMDNRIDSKFWSKIATVGYDATMSSADMIFGSATLGSTGYGIAMGMGAATDYAHDALERGADTKQIIFGSLLTGIAEGLFEKFSLDKIVKMSTGGTLKSFAVNTLKSAGVEGSEEFFTEIADQFIDNVVMGAKSKDSIRIRELMQKGYTRSQAEQMSGFENFTDAFWAFVTGAVSGGQFGAVSNAKSNIVASEHYKEIGKKISENNSIDAVINEAKGLNSDSEAYKLAMKLEAKLKDGKTVSDKQKGQLVSLANEQLEKEYSRKAMSVISEAQATEAAARIETKMKEKGETAANSKSIAKIVSKSLSGENLSITERVKLKTNPIANEVLNEMRENGSNADWIDMLNSNIRTATRQEAESINNINTAYMGNPTASVSYENAKGEKINAQFKAIKNYNDDKTIDIELTNGEVINSAVAEFKDSSLEEMIDIATAFQPDTANAFIKAYNGSQNFYTYATGFEVAYKYGHAGMSLESALSANIYGVTDTQIKLAYNLGVADKSKAVNNAEKEIQDNRQERRVKGKGELINPFSNSELTDKQKASVEFAKTLCDIGINVELFKNEADSKGNITGENGNYNPVTNTISLDIDAGLNNVNQTDLDRAILRTASHELTHFIQRWSPKQYENLKTFVLETLNKYDKQKVDKLANIEIENHKSQGHSISYDEAVDEVVANACEMMLKDSKAIQKLASENLKLAEKIHKFIKDFSEKVKKAFTGVKANSYVATEIERILDSLDELQKIWDNALSDAVHNMQNTSAQRVVGVDEYGREIDQDGDLIFELREDFSKELQNWFDNTSNEERKTSGKRFLLGTTTNVLKSIGVKDYNIYFGGSKINKILNDNASMNLEIIKDAVKLLNDPILIMQSRTVDDSIVVFGEVYTNNKPVMISVLLNPKTKNGEVLDYGVVTSAYGRRNNNLQNLINKSEIYYINEQKERTDKWLKALGLQLPSAITKYGSINSISKNNNNVKYSLRDSEYMSAVKNGDTEKVQRLVDEAAKEAGFNSPRLYHGTYYFGFTEFDLNKMDDKRSIFLTSSKEIASTYSGVESINKISERNNVDVDKLSIQETVELLNQHAQEPTIDYSYSYMDMKDINNLISKVNSDIEYLKGEVDKEIEKFKNDTGVLNKLNDLKTSLEKYQYDRLSTKIYILLHYHDTFRSSAEQSNKISQIEQNIRLMNTLIKSGITDCVVEKALGGYSIKLMSVYEAKEKLKECINKGNYSLYAKLENPLVVEAGGNYWNSIDYIVPYDRYEIRDGRYNEGTFEVFNRSTMQPEWINDKLDWDTFEEAQKALDTLEDKQWEKRLNTTREISEYAQEQGYDSVIFKNLIDNGGNNVKVKEETIADIYIIFNPNNVKSADAVTYDDNGNVIPLSQRFDNSKSDIRYSLRNLSPIERSTNRILREYRSQSDLSSVAQQLKGIYTMMENGNNADSEIKALAQNIAENITEESERNEDYGYIKEFIQGYGMQVTDEIKSEFQSDWQRFFKKNNLRLKLNRNGKHGVDEVYKDLCAEFPAHFDGDAKGPAEQLREMSEVLDDLKGGEKIELSAEDKEQLTDLIADRIKSEYSEYKKAEETYIDENDMSNRGILGRALLYAAQTTQERNKLDAYRRNTKKLNRLEKELKQVGAELKELYFESGSRDVAKIKQLQKNKAQISKQINSSEKLILDIEATQPIKDLLTREKKKVRQETERKLKAAHRQRETEIKAGYEQKIKEQKERTKKRVEGRKTTELKIKIKKALNDIDSMAKTNTKSKHIPLGLESVVADLNEAIDRSYYDYDARIDSINERIYNPSKRLYDPKTHKKETESKLKEMLKNAEIRRDKAKMALGELNKFYTGLKEESNPNHSIYDENISSAINEVANINKPLYDMSRDELTKVYECIQMVKTVIRNQNKLFKASRGKTLEEKATAMNNELKSMGIKERRHFADFLDKARNGAKSFNYSLLKPAYLFDMLGENAYDIYKGLRDGQNVFANDLYEAKERFQKIARENNYFRWNNPKKFYEVRLQSGETLNLNIEELMMIYIASKREQYIDHLTKGGIVIERTQFKQSDKKIKGIKGKTEFTDETPHPLTAEDIGKVTDMLSEEQKRYADAMQSYLANEMGAKGNEVTEQLWGIHKFKDKTYFPIKSSQNFLESSNKEVNAKTIKNSGFAKDTVTGANNPVVISSLTEVWESHIQEMSLFHGFALGVEDANRIFNYNFWSYDELTGESSRTGSIKTSIANAFGQQANKAISSFIIDLNGGVRNNGVGALNNLISKFKKNAVFFSLSVTVQQPSAIGRAMALVDDKYFWKTTLKGRGRKTWEEVKKYSPIAKVKEMGSFDTSVGLTDKEWLTHQELSDYKGIIGKAKGLIKNRDDFFSFTAQKADEITWCHIWNAVKAETRAKYPSLYGEALLKKAGQRFEEVIDKTQVYDSVFARAEMMRKKDFGANAITSFMAEPLTTLNMAVKAGKDFNKTGGKKRFVKTCKALIYSAVLNSLLLTIVTASRGQGEDDDETWSEAYLGELMQNMLDYINPLTYIPIARDVSSLIQGYDVERPDMSIISDLVDAFDVLFDTDKPINERIIKFSGAVGAFAGLPIRNFTRDVKAVINTYFDATDDITTTEKGKIYAIERGFADSFFGAVASKFGYEFDRSKYNRLVDAYIDGDKEQSDRLYKEIYNKKKNETGKSDSEIKEDIKSKVKSGIKNKYLADEIAEDKAESLLKSYAGIDEKKALLEIKKWNAFNLDSDGDGINDKYDADGDGKEDSYSQYSSILSEVVDGDADGAADEMNELEKMGVKEKDVVSNTVKAIKDSYIKGKITIEQAIKIYSKLELVKTDNGYAKPDKNDIYWKQREWEYNKENGTGDDVDDFSRYSSLDTAIANENRTGIKSAVDELIEYNFDDDKTYDDKVSSVQSACSKKLKEMYLSGDTSKALRTMYYLRDTYGMYSGSGRKWGVEDYIKKWLKGDD